MVLLEQLACPARGMLEARPCNAVPAGKGDELLLHPCTWHPGKGAGGLSPAPLSSGSKRMQQLNAAHPGSPTKDRGAWGTLAWGGASPACGDALSL